jgi:hypothetical protein
MPDSRKCTVNFRDAEFTRASRARQREQCVEFASKDGHVALRDSRRGPSGGRASGTNPV